MYRKDDIGKIHGVLNDWDLATNEESRHDGSERMGTLPFMAQELLDSIHWKLPIEHLYRHDLEAFYSILIWYCNCIEKGKEISHEKLRQFRAWTTGNYRRAEIRFES